MHCRLQVSLVHLQIFVTTKSQLFNAKLSHVKLELEKIWIVYHGVNNQVELLTA